jgi:hypothetical protein
MKLGYTHGEKWTDELIEERIMNIVNKQETYRLGKKKNHYL